jgi:AraC-like DNA-binding protein
MPSPAYDLIFDKHAFRAEIIFVGTRCSQDDRLRDYRTGALHFVRAGCAEVMGAGPVPLRIDEPSLVFFPNACPHWVRAVDDRGFDLVCALASFDETFSRALRLSMPGVVVLPLGESAGIGTLLDAFFSEACSSAPGSKQLAERLCEVVLGHLVRHGVASGRLDAGLLAAASDRRVAAALQAIHTRFDQDLDVDALAREAGMSRTRFVERFKALVGASPHHYLVGYRIGVAQRLLTSRLPVKAVAQRVGFATASAFVRRFKELVGQSPAAWAAPRAE